MSPTFHRACIVLCLGAFAWAPGPAPAQPAAPMAQPSEEQIIERLTRGIRVPTARPPVEPGAASKEQPSMGAPSVVAPPMDEPPPAEAPSISLTVLFPTGSARVTREAAQALHSLGRALNSDSLRPFRFRVEGHTDTVGNAAMNLRLSDLRAAAVREHLIEKYGIAPRRLVAEGFGQSRPLIPTGDNVPEARNRRVQIVNLGQ